jgi:hypothetical protein
LPSSSIFLDHFPGFRLWGWPAAAESLTHNADKARTRDACGNPPRKPTSTGIILVIAMSRSGLPAGFPVSGDPGLFT